ncbi:MAG: bifunctional methylenetetrahydrofolate dehydrogenase/methenyltetrahydrofolate cyclohydrolase FolD [Ectothiorhodospiraceae bacterium]|nr:bifunctional methylenetetrahydrofolate dehydrogenase/methenyltetrahydrofolate cyclohydrolase FolD [Ectothiorhodospiraceae bacterium]
MTAKTLDGKAAAERLHSRIQTQVRQRLEQGRRRPGLAVILVGDDPASRVYVGKKRKLCEQVGFLSRGHDLPAATSQDALLALVDELNADPAIDGILVQLPLPGHIDASAVIERIDPAKDVDGFHPVSMGRLALRLPGLRPCTPHGVMTLLRDAGIPLEGKDAIILGQSNIVGRPMALELLNARCTPTICHSRTAGLPEKIAQADIVVAAVGRPHFVRGDWIKPGAAVVDVGIHRLDNGKLTGDVDFHAAKERAGWITPVPGGVGPMTVATLLENTLQAAEARDR